jgi:16S rRNA (guanine1207-N2)-methyltransferase
MTSRLSAAIETGLVRLPDEGRIAVFGGQVGDLLAEVPKDRAHVIQRDAIAAEAATNAGYAVSVHPEGDYAAAIVCVPRARDAARGLVAVARRATAGPIIVDGQKTDGVETLLRDLRKRADVGAPLSKAHGKIFVVEGGDLDDWLPARRDIGGFVTFPGVFSADGVDRASALLAAALPKDMTGRIADLGAGWGYLSRAILASPAVVHLHLIEADAEALDCARVNVTDPRAQFHWADATRFAPPEPLDAVVCNPPFHTGRQGDPELGRAFIRAAAAMLDRNGVLWLVANRHLPYEQCLADTFAEVRDIGGDGGFKLIRATRPRVKKRG